MTSTISSTQLIAENLGCLPHPDGTMLAFVSHMAAQHLPEEMQDQIKRTSLAVAEALTNLLEINGLAITEKANEMTSTQPNVVQLHCATCGGVLQTVVMGADGKISIALGSINPDCATAHGAA